MTKLYLAPGAQPAPSSQDEWKTLAKDLLREIERQTCAHEETHRGGFLWEICDSCGAKWADDEGGKPEFKWPKVVEKARAMIEGTPSIPEGWLRAIDEALVVAHIGVANESDTYEQAKVKLDSLIGFHVDVATDPAVNGGYKLVPIEPTKTFYQCFSAYDGTSYSNPFDYDDFVKDWREALVVAPEAKP